MKNQIPGEPFEYGKFGDNGITLITFRASPYRFAQGMQVLNCMNMLGIRHRILIRDHEEMTVSAPEWVAIASKAYFANDGFADLSLAEYLRKVQDVSCGSSKS